MCHVPFEIFMVFETVFKSVAHEWVLISVFLLWTRQSFCQITFMDSNMCDFSYLLCFLFVFHFSCFLKYNYVDNYNWNFHDNDNKGVLDFRV